MVPKRTVISLIYNAHVQAPVFVGAIPCVLHPVSPEWIVGTLNLGRKPKGQKHIS